MAWKRKSNTSVAASCRGGGAASLTGGAVAGGREAVLDRADSRAVGPRGPKGPRGPIEAIRPNWLARAHPPPPPGPLGSRGRSPPFGTTPASSRKCHLPPFSPGLPPAPHLPQTASSSARQEKTPQGPRARCEPLTRYSTIAPITFDGTSERRQFHPHRHRLPWREHPPCHRQIAGFRALSRRHRLAKPEFGPAIAT